ncbi:MAG: glutamine amidotransferase [Planktomarina sp.]
MATDVIFGPLLPWLVVYVLAVVALAITVLAIWRRLVGWPFRALAAVVIVLAFANPSLQREDREEIPDIAVVVVDETSSQSIRDRSAQSTQALAEVQAALAGHGNTDVRVVTVDDTDRDGGTQLVTALSDALSDVPADRLAGAFLITDGLTHDADLSVDPSAPVHVLLTGDTDDWDRQLTIRNAPAFGILGELLEITLVIEDFGAAPDADFADLNISIDGGPPELSRLPIGEDLIATLQLPHGGINVLQISTPTVEGELTDRNNTAVLRINGVRDRLRVMLVSGEPHPGERTWRNLLKSDASVDLVHFTILKPPGKQGGVPVSELSLIAFPTRELFLEKIDEFDLIIFDRYKRRGILPSAYIANIARYVRDGGAVLVSAGPDYAGVDSIFRSPLGDVLPAAPTARVFEEPVTPTVSDLGTRHPVTQGLQTDVKWGRWLRQVEVEALSGDIIMTGLYGRPLLVVDRVGQGRTALLASDHAWLWDRGFEGGGPQRELLRRLSHWMMKEPELEEEALTATETEEGLLFTRRTLEDRPAADLRVTGPDGTDQTLVWALVAPGQFEAALPTTELGLYRATDNDLDVVTALGPAAPREFQQTIATATRLQGLVDQRQGGVVRIVDGIPRIRTVRDGRPAAGRGWLGVYERGAYSAQSVTLSALLPAWVYLLLAAGLMVAAWLREGRRV